jgi:hypothetical protein
MVFTNVLECRFEQSLCLGSTVAEESKRRIVKRTQRATQLTGHVIVVNIGR